MFRFTLTAPELALAGVRFVLCHTPPVGGFSELSGTEYCCSVDMSVN